MSMMIYKVPNINLNVVQGMMRTIALQLHIDGDMEMSDLRRVCLGVLSESEENETIEGNKIDALYLTDHEYVDLITAINLIRRYHGNDDVIRKSCEMFLFLLCQLDQSYTQIDEKAGP